MCSVFEFNMDQDYQGDLTDIVRASGSHVVASTGSASSGAPPPPPPLSSFWQFPSYPPVGCQSDINSHHHVTADTQNSYFGDPFLSMSDPLLHELNIVAASRFVAPRSNISNDGGDENIIPDDELKGHCSIFPRIRISHSVNNHDFGISPHNSPATATVTSSLISSPRGIARSQGPSMVSLGDMMSVGGSNSSNTSDIISVGPTSSPKTCLVDNTGAQLQISSPRNLSLKRRKSQAKKVVCIPAPAAANTRSSGEVVPSDLWAWRKYGQKPIKGSPYPRGYYRCSSSKGCSARKQVERSRTDPNMLVITYTSEHNHPWPTQRNALACSTRSTHPTKSCNAALKNSQNANSVPKDALKDQIGCGNATDEAANMSSPGNTGAGCSTSTNSVKEETEKDDQNDDHEEKKLDMMDHSDGIHSVNDDYSSISHQPYRPAMPDFHQSEDFFADLDELAIDPLSVLFTQGLSTASSNREKDKHGLDPLENLFDWPGENNVGINSMNTASFGEPARSL